MSEESDQETSELDIQKRTWNKLEKNMKLFGFREGAAEGKNLSLQEGFNLGFIDGFQLGEYLGIGKGVVNCEAELRLSPNKKTCLQEDILEKLTSQPCALCLEEKNFNKPLCNDVSNENFDNIISSQHSHSNIIMNTIKNSDVVSYFDKR